MIEPNLSYEMALRFPPEALQHIRGLRTKGGFLLPQDIDLDAATLTVTNRSAYLHVMWRGRKPDGTRHLRRTSKTITFSNGHTGMGWLNELLPGNDNLRIRAILRDLWPSKVL